MLNWAKIRNEYINGNISYEKLAKKHKVSIQAIKEKGAKEKWVAQKKEQQAKIRRKTDQKTAEKIAEKQSDLAADIQSAASELLKKLNIAIQQTDLYIEKTKKRLPKKVQNPETGETYIAYHEEENIRLSQKEGINVSSVKQLASALKDLQAIQLGSRGEQAQESPNINITIATATPDDIEHDNDDE